MATVALRDKAIVLRPEDDVAIAKAEICVGTVLEDAGGTIEARQDIRPGHKICRRDIPLGNPVRRYGQVIGFATQDIARGDHVHSHNLAIGELHREYEVGTDVRPVDYYPPAEMRYFEGYRREDGRVGTRNYVAVISTVFRTPPDSWIVRIVGCRSGWPGTASLWRSTMTTAWFTSQPSPIRR